MFLQHFIFSHSSIYIIILDTLHLLLFPLEAYGFPNIAHLESFLFPIFNRS